MILGIELDTTPLIPSSVQWVYVHRALSGQTLPSSQWAVAQQVLDDCTVEDYNTISHKALFEQLLSKCSLVLGRVTVIKYSTCITGRELQTCAMFTKFATKVIAVTFVVPYQWVLDWQELVGINCVYFWYSLEINRDLMKILKSLCYKKSISINFKPLNGYRASIP